MLRKEFHQAFPFSANITNRFQYLCNFIKNSNRNKFPSARNCFSLSLYICIYIFGPLLKLCPKFIVMRRFYLDLLKTNIFCCQSMLLLLLSRQQKETDSGRGREVESVCGPNVNTELSNNGR